MIKLCIFDLDGTVLNTLETIAYYGNYALENNNLKPIPVNDYKMLVGTGALNLIKNMLKYNNCYSEELLNKVFPVYSEAYNSNTTFKTKPYEGICDTLSKLKDQGIKIAIVSNKPHFAANSVVTKIFGEGYFDYIFGQTEGIPIKPDPTSVLSVVEMFGVKKEECLYIGDTSTDMHTGKNANIFTIGVSWGFREKQELIESGANLIIDKPCELSEYIEKNNK